MIGSFKGSTAGNFISSGYNVLLSPGVINVFSLPGSATSPLVTASATGGIGPYKYEWSITGSNIIINNPASESTTFRASGNSISYEEVATITVTDEGNSDTQTSTTINVNFSFRR